MAKISQSVTFKNAVINTDDMTITEITKDEEKIYDLKKVLNEWNGIEGIGFSIKQDNELPTDDE